MQGKAAINKAFLLHKLALRCFTLSFSLFSSSYYTVEIRLKNLTLHTPDFMEIFSTMFTALHYILNLI